MCRLFGFRSNVPSQAHRSLVEAENAVSAQARAHGDGWGIGWFLGRDPYVLKSDGSAASDERFHRISKRLTSHTFLVHVRRATVGQVDQLNSHPFRHGRWMFAHNGTIFGFDAVRERLLEQTLPELRPLVFGSTDSEHLFYFLLSCLYRHGLCHLGHEQLDACQVALAVRDGVEHIYRWCADAGLDPPICNLILTNGEVMVAMRAGLELFLATQKTSCRDYERCTAEKICFAALRPLPVPGRIPRGPVRRCNHLLVASEPISTEDIWEELPQGHLLALDPSLQLYMFEPPPSFQPNPDWPRPRSGDAPLPVPGGRAAG